MSKSSSVFEGDKLLRTRRMTVYDAGGNRVASKVDTTRQYMVYDAMGKLVAEYGQKADGLGGVKYVQQDWQGSVRTVTNNNAFAGPIEVAPRAGCIAPDNNWICSPLEIAWGSVETWNDPDPTNFGEEFPGRWRRRKRKE
jgi:hypothetical protein